MASSGLASGAFLTTISGRRCTAVPRVAAASTSASSVTTVVTTTSSTSPTSTTSTASTTTTSPTNALVVAPIAGIDASTEAAQQSSTSTTSSSLATRTNPPSGSVRIAQAQDSESGSTARPPPPRPAAPPASDAAPQSFTAFAAVSPSQASVSQSSQADASVTAAAADTPLDPAEAAPAETASPDLPQGPVATPLLTTIESPQTPVEPPQTPTDTLAADATGTTSADAALTPIPNLNNNAVQSTVAVAGGVIGGVVAISVLAFFIWWWRRRLQRRRRSTLLTPLDVASYDRDEKGGYVISRGSIGPTPVAVKVKAALDHNFKKIRGHIRNRTAPSVNLDRGTSQFIDPATSHSRANSGIIGAEPAATDRLKGWWSGLGRKFNRRDDSAQQSTGAAQEKKASSSQPDFLTLLNMDDGELDREAQRRRASIARLNGRASSADGFLGGLNLNFGSDDPFSDANAIAHTSAKPAPLAVNQPSPVANPFSDTNAIRDPPPAAMTPKPSTYVADIRRSRSNSTSVAGGVTGGRQPSTLVYNYPRDSAASLRSMATATTTNQRTKFRSDPFDLERPELLGKSPAVLPTIVSGGSTASSAAATFGSATPSPGPGPTQMKPPPRTARTTRAESFSSRYSKYSKYSSGVSALSAEDVIMPGRSGGGPPGGGGDDWSDPGPDVGPGSAGGARWGAGDGNGAGAAGWRERLAREREDAATAARGQTQKSNGGGGRLSGNSLGSVGKAM